MKEITCKVTIMDSSPFSSHVTVVQYLVEQGTYKDKNNNNGVGPLCIASQNGHSILSR